MRPSSFALSDYAQTVLFHSHGVAVDKRWSVQLGLVIKITWGSDSMCWPVTPALSRQMLEGGFKASLRALERWLSN